MPKIFLLIFLSSLSLIINAQSENIEEIGNRRYINNAESNIIFHLSQVKHNRKYNPSKRKTYHWYKTQEIIKTQGGYSGQLLDGEFVAYYSNKQLKEKGKFNKGLKAGKWIKWNSDGSILSMELWWRGKRIRSIKKF